MKTLILFLAIFIASLVAYNITEAVTNAYYRNDILFLESDSKIVVREKDGKPTSEMQRIDSPCGSVFFVPIPEKLQAEYRATH